jgi:hypothetical protein
MLELLESVLVVLVGSVMKFTLDWLGVPVDAETFNALVVAIVSALLALAGGKAANKSYPSLFK